MNFLCTYIYKNLRNSRKKEKKYEKILKIIKSKIRHTRLQNEMYILKDVAVEQNETLIEINEIITDKLNEKHHSIDLVKQYKKFKRF